MGTIQPRARGGASLSETLKARRLREEQLGRQRVIIPNPKAAAVVAGSVGSTMATGSHALLFPGTLAFTGWSFSQAFDDGAGGPTLAASGANDFTIGEAGWYQLGLVKRVGFSGGGPGAVEVEFNLSSVGYEPVWTVPLVSAAQNPQGTDGAMVDVGSRILRLTAGEVVSPRIRWNGSAVIDSSSTAVFVTRVG